MANQPKDQQPQVSAEDQAAFEQDMEHFVGLYEQKARITARNDARGVIEQRQMDELARRVEENRRIAKIAVEKWRQGKAVKE